MKWGMSPAPMSFARVVWLAQNKDKYLPKEKD
jgi:hypothetical protein